MAVNIKNILIIFLMLSVYTYPNNNFKNKDVVLKSLKDDIKISKDILSERIGICLNKGNVHIPKLQNIDLQKDLKKNDIINFLKYKYHKNFTNCLEQKDHLYIYNLSKLYHAQKEYNISTDETLSDINNYFEPIEGLDTRIEYKKTPDTVKRYFNQLLKDKPFNVIELIKIITRD